MGAVAIIRRAHSHRRAHNMSVRRIHLMPHAGGLTLRAEGHTIADLQLICLCQIFIDKPQRAPDGILHHPGDAFPAPVLRVGNQNSRLPF